MTTRRAVAIAVVALVLSCVAAVLLGPRALGAGEAMAALRGSGSPMLRTLLWAFRLPRVVGAVLLGALLGLSGGMLQRSTRNLLADPGLLGLHAGAQVALLVLLLRVEPLVAGRWRAPVAFVGAAAAAGIVWLLARRDGEVHPRRLLLIGIAVGAGLHAVGLALAFAAPGEVFSRALIWSTGTLGGVRWSDDALLAGALLLLTCVALPMARALDALGLGEESAALVGVHVARVRLVSVTVAVSAAALCTAVGGGIAFVGLLAPNLALRLTGPRTRPLLLLAVVTGAIVVVVADTLARTLLGAAELPTGVLVAMVGAPYFLWLLVTR